jgi:uncharacterized protein with HEPN domain
MSKRASELYVLDILIAYDKIMRYTQHIDSGDDLLHDEIIWDATIRELEIIGEATKNLIQENIIDNTNRRIVDFRNQIAHGYFGIDADIVFDVIHNKLHHFTQTLSNLNLNLYHAIKLAQKEHQHNQNILNLLTKLEENN